MKIVVDAGLGVQAVVDGPVSEQVTSAWESWLDRGAAIEAPGLWQNEVTSAIHKIFQAGLISEESAVAALEAALDLGVEVVPETPELCRDAFEWATRLGQMAAYDGFYLALAQARGAQFWSTDRSLVRNARHKGVSWVHWVGDL